MDKTHTDLTRLTLWGRLCRWLNGPERQGPPEKLKFDLPRKGSDTDIILSQKQKEKLQNAVDTAFYTRETSFYSRDGGSRGSSQRSSSKDVIL